MMCLSQTSGYAVHALSCLRDEHSETCQVADIAELTGIPKPYLAKILNKLNHHGLVYCKRGYRGGIALGRPAKEITVLQVVEAVEGPDWIADCLLGVEDCAARKICPTHKAWLKVRKQIRDMLQGTTLADTERFSRQKFAHNATGQARKRGPQPCCK